MCRRERPEDGRQGRRFSQGYYSAEKNKFNLQLISTTRKFPYITPPERDNARVSTRRPKSCLLLSTRRL